MKKDIKWLKEAVGELNLVDTEFEADGMSYMDSAVSVTQVYDLIDQLDDAEVLSHEWVDKYQYVGTDPSSAFVYVKDLQNLLVPKQELPVLPKYMHEWIMNYRDKYDLYPALRLLENNTLVWGEIYEWYRMNTHKFVNAYLTGEYEVENKPLYHALIKGHELLANNDARDCSYWNLSTYGGRVFPSDKSSKDGLYSTKMSKSKWNELGINDSNADFVRVEENE